MKDFLERMVAEEKELNGRLRKIHRFCDPEVINRPDMAISDRALNLLEHQMLAMELYAFFLRERISLAKQENKDEQR